MKYCQKCGMQIVSERHYGTNYDQSLNRDFCSDCYREGGFVANDGFNSFDLAITPMAFAYTSSGVGAFENGMTPYGPPLFIDIVDEEEEVSKE